MTAGWQDPRRQQHHEQQRVRYSLPDLKFVGGLEVGLGPNWVTTTPDSKFAYVSVDGENVVSVVDIKALKEVARIKVGQVPKRNETMLVRQ